ncbi:PREDICTED: RING finger protein 121-like isoform X2 [Priapulus caudatus]|nr:PREDICTED: RING finger protein 121-like isoform X2 [Priapulus caudatus]
MHAEMVLILIAAIFVAQVALVQWKKLHFRSYQLLTLIAMMVIPVGICVSHHWWRFIICWCVFNMATGFVMFKATRPLLAGSTPRLVYKWFYLIYKISYGLGIVGYLAIMLTLLGVNALFLAKPNTWMDFGILCLYYGLYYGVVGRDLAEICTDKIAAKVGYYSHSGLPARGLEPGICSVCGNHLLVTLGDNDSAVIEKTYQLNCGHVFHEFCIRGWCIIGKKQICPYCREKVDLKRVFKNPWERPHVLYGQLLDWIRYMVAWQPLIISAVQGINYLLGLE